MAAKKKEIDYPLNKTVFLETLIAFQTIDPEGGYTGKTSGHYEDWLWSYEEKTEQQRLDLEEGEKVTCKKLSYEKAKSMLSGLKRSASRYYGDGGRGTGQKLNFGMPEPKPDFVWEDWEDHLNKGEETPPEIPSS